MTDVYQSQQDPNRILINTTTGGVQAWKPNGTAVSLSFDLVPSAGDGHCYGHACFSQFMTIADARSIAAALLKAADHAESLLPQQEAAA